ncbi:MAG TPA: PEP/pyruvate-binding domain-containing protein [Candidatus Omnitrophota bacterium]|nr:PEP/pyruvate-binding domain-containing protein [Candidatus Omnitrophota bacterium]
MYSTGITGLDEILSGLKLGDNVVWQVNTVENYIDFVRPFVQKALEEKRRMVYIRFADHPPNVEPHKDIIVYQLDASAGFESFSVELNSIISKEGEGVFYVIDCLSYLLSEWSNDLMIGNFFKITCPYLYQLDTITYFGLLRNSHSFKTIARIRDTTQLLIDVYHYENNYYVHPLKVWQRYSPTMFLPHIKKGDRFEPITNSADASNLFSHTFMEGAKSIRRNLDFWDQLFLKAASVMGQEGAEQEKAQMMDQLCRITIARDEKLLDLAKRHFTLKDLLDIKARMIGTGFIGGKSVGMLIARNILAKDESLKSRDFEPHDSFYIGSDVFYTYIVENGWWQARMKQRTKESYFSASKELKEKLLHGVFPEEIAEQFKDLIEYFGQSPIIVRSSSLLEDSYGNAFAGKYESVFLANQGTPEQRYKEFIKAVRLIYASTMNEDALVYRLQRGLDQMDEQMALLVQRVSGAYHEDYFFPDAAGVGLSYNTFVWKDGLDPKAGVLRIVVGLGTRAVDRVEGDYARIVALDDPLVKPHASSKDAQRFSQHKLDVINVRQNCFQSVFIRDLLREKIQLNLGLIASKDYETIERLRSRGIEEDVWIMTFDRLFSESDFGSTVQKILKTLETAYGYPVDIEFTVNFKADNEFQFNLLQCRPLKTKGWGKRVKIPAKIDKGKMVFESFGNFLGGNIAQTINRIIYVDPQAYAELMTQSQKYDIARIIGELNHLAGSREQLAVMLLGPGRWGTSTPSLGVPVSFAEISNIAVLGEIAFETSNAVPELSFGTHFFQDLVETDILYLALFPDDEKVYLNRPFFMSQLNLLSALVPDHKKYEHVIKVLDMGERKLTVSSDIISQRILCYFS